MPNLGGLTQRKSFVSFAKDTIIALTYAYEHDEQAAIDAGCRLPDKALYARSSERNDKEDEVEHTPTPG